MTTPSSNGADSASTTLTSGDTRTCSHVTPGHPLALCTTDHMIIT